MHIPFTKCLFIPLVLKVIVDVVKGWKYVVWEFHKYRWRPGTTKQVVPLIGTFWVEILVIVV